MDQDTNKKHRTQFTKKIRQSFLSVLKPFQSKPQPMEHNFEPEIKQFDPLLDLCEFEYIYSSMTSVSETSINKLSDCIKIMKSEPIDQRKLSNFLIMGMDDELKALRGVTWRILMGYLPPMRKQWVNILGKNRKNYLSFIDEHILKKIKKIKPSVQADDHPLNRDKNSTWNNYFEDVTLWNSIEKDTKRTRQKETFFNQINEDPVYIEVQSYIDQIETEQLAILSKRRIEMQETHFDVLTRILYLYIKLNGGQYIQGMNEIAAVIYYVFANDACQLLTLQAEVDTFYCFSIFMTEFRNNFSQDSVGVCNRFMQDRIRVFGELLKKVDPRLHEQLVVYSQIDLKFFMIKWFTTCFAQEFTLYDTVRIWDAIICEIEDKNDFLQYIALAILHQMREDILKGEFGDIMMKLQSLNASNLQTQRIIENAYLVKKQFKK